jgi:hypothetical protein
VNRFGTLVLSIVATLPAPARAEDRPVARVETTDGRVWPGLWDVPQPFQVESDIGIFVLAAEKIKAVQLQDLAYYPTGGTRYVGSIETVSGLTVKGNIVIPSFTMTLQGTGPAGDGTMEDLSQEAGTLTISDSAKIKTITFEHEESREAEPGNRLPPIP